MSKKKQSYDKQCGFVYSYTGNCVCMLVTIVYITPSILSNIENKVVEKMEKNKNTLIICCRNS